MLSPNRSENGFWLAILRIGVSLALIGKLNSELRYIDELYGANGFAPGDVVRFSQLALIPSLSGMYQVVSGMCTESVFLHVFFLCQMLFAFFLLMGYRSRMYAVMCWAMQVVVFNSSHLTSYGFDAILLSLLFYAMILPVGRYLSIDHRTSPERVQTDETMIPVYLKVIQLHVCLIYLVNGISKVSGHSWQNGSGMWDAIHQPQFESYLSPLLQHLFIIKGLPALVTWAAVLVEIAYPFLIWVRGLNRILLLSIILLHVFIAVVFGLWLFAFTMIVFNLVAFGNVLKKYNLKHIET